MPDFEPLERLGAGNFGEVWLVYDRALNVRRAVKYVQPSRIHDATEFYSEPRTLMRLRHENIVRVEDAGTEDDGTLYIAMEYLPAGSLESKYRGRPVRLSNARRILCDICWGLEYAHQEGFIHRDIKPGNVLIGGRGVAKLSDFGLATRAPRGAVASVYGYVTHLAPEVFSYNATSVATDIYALGVTAYRLVNGDAFLRTPDDEDALADAIVAGQYPDRKHYRPHVPSTVRTVINKAMHVDPRKRTLSASGFRQALERIEILCDWTWRSRRRGGVDYSTRIGASRIKVAVRREAPNRFAVTTTKRVGDGSARRVRDDCAESLTQARLRQTVHRILTRYVTRGK